MRGCMGARLQGTKHVTTARLQTGPPLLGPCREKGANLAVDVPYKYLNFFLDDDEKLAEIAK